MTNTNPSDLMMPEEEDLIFKILNNEKLKARDLNNYPSFILESDFVKRKTIFRKVSADLYRRYKTKIPGIKSPKQILTCLQILRDKKKQAVRNKRYKLKPQDTIQKQTNTIIKLQKEISELKSVIATLKQKCKQTVKALHE